MHLVATIGSRDIPHNFQDVIKMYKIGEIAKRVGLGNETVRYYEQAGILPPAERAPNGYRLYDNDHLKHLRFIKRSRELGFSLEKVRSLLSLSNNANMTCKSVKAIAEVHLEEVRRNIADLRAMEKSLAEMVEPCSGDGSNACPILDVLFSDD